MVFKVELSEPARQDIFEAAEFIALDSTERAKRWILLLEDLFTSLSEMPRRFPAVPELSPSALEFREARHFSHRIVYRLDQESATVTILRVYHAARRPLGASDV